MNVINIITRNYKNFIPLVGHKNKPNQTQFKANTNPISEMPKMNLNFYPTRDYNNETAFRRIKNRPNSNPKQTQFFTPLFRVPPAPLFRVLYTLRGFTLRGPAMNLKMLAKKSCHTPLGCGNKFFDNSFLRLYISSRFATHTNLYIFRKGTKR
jgi:hypothetical protein